MGSPLSSFSSLSPPPLYFTCILTYSNVFYFTVFFNILRIVGKKRDPRIQDPGSQSFFSQNSEKYSDGYFLLLKNPEKYSKFGKNTPKILTKFWWENTENSEKYSENPEKYSEKYFWKKIEIQKNTQNSEKYSELGKIFRKTWK